MVLYGFHNLQDLAAARVSGANVEAVNDAINDAVAEHNRQIGALMRLFVDPTELYTERYAQTSAASLQPLDDNGRALPIKPSGYYNVAYPIQQGGSAWGANYVTRAKMTVRDAERITGMMLQADARWMRDRILAALFSSASYTFVDPLYGDLTIQPLANGDAVTYGVQSGGDTSSTDTHQLGQANAIGAGADNPYPTIYTELTEHPENSGDVIAFIPTGLKTATEALTTFYPVADGNLQPGSGTTVLTGDLGVETPGKLIGYEDSGVWIVEWKALPANYIVAVTTGGDRPLAMRQDPEPELQGFKRVAERDDHPFYESQWLRRAGFGARNRVGAVVMEVADASYDVPTGYTAPI